MSRHTDQPYLALATSNGITGVREIGNDFFFLEITSAMVRKLRKSLDSARNDADLQKSLVDFDQRYSAYPTPTYPSDSVSVAKNSKDVTGKTKSARNFIHTSIR